MRTRPDIVASHQPGAGPAQPPLGTESSGGTCIKSALLPVDARCLLIVLENPSLFCDANRELMELAGVASASPRKFYRLDGRPLFRTPDIPGCFQTNERRAKPSLPPNSAWRAWADVGKDVGYRGVRGAAHASCCRSPPVGPSLRIAHF